MSTTDTCCSIVPYFKVRDGKMTEFKRVCEQLLAKTTTENGCLYYGFSFNNHEAHCREAYTNARALLAHLENIAEPLGEALQLSELSRLEIHGPEAELKTLRPALANLKPTYFTLEYGFRR